MQNSLQPNTNFTHKFKTKVQIITKSSQIKQRSNNKLDGQHPQLETQSSKTQGFNGQNLARMEQIM